MSCKKCGKCCSPIIMNYSMDYLKEAALKDCDKDALFLFNDCIKISAKEAKTLRDDILDIDNPLRYNLFVCWHFNDESRLCENNNKPSICKRFPGTQEIDKKCGYYISLQNIRSVR